MLDKPVTIVLGGTGSVGRAVTAMLQDRGHQAIIGGRNPEKLRRVSEEHGCQTFLIDADHPQTIVNAITVVRETYGEISGLVNCIGSILLKPAHLTTDDEFSEVLQTNLWTSFAAIRAAGTEMREGGGSVVLVSTAATRIGIANHEAIAAAKAGVEGLARSAAATYAKTGLRVNVVAPGLVKSEMSKQIWENDNSAAASRDLHALDRLGEPRDVASLIVWLLEPENSWITGQVIGIDGGLGSVLRRQRASLRK